MSAAPQGSRVCTKEQSSLIQTHLHDPEVKRSLGYFLELCQSSLGPQGHLKVIHNGAGGHVTITSTSSRLFQTISVSKPVLQLITSAILEHIKCFYDGGLFVAVFSTQMTLSVIDKTYNPRLLIDSNELFMDMCIEYMDSNRRTCKVAMSWDTTDRIILLIKSILTSKPACLLSKNTVDNLSRILLKAFLQTYYVQGRSVVFHPVQFLDRVGPSAEESFVVDGILFQTPHIPSYQRLQSLKDVASPTGDRAILIALVNVSLAGESEEFEEANYEIGIDIDIAAVVEKKIITFAQRLITDGVGILACQKVVCPSVKKLLRENGVLVLDRMALTFTQSLNELAGGRIISSIHGLPDVSDYGTLSSVHHKVIDNKSYLNVIGKQEYGTCTVVLTSPSEEAVAELKALCKCIIHALKTLVVKPFALCGGGCWQTHLTFYLANQVNREVSNLTTAVECNRHQLLDAMENFCHVLIHSATKQLARDKARYVDSVYGHLWVTENEEHSVPIGTSCQCQALLCDETMAFQDICAKTNFPSHVAGRQTDYRDLPSGNYPTVLDSFMASFNAFRNAVAIGNMVIGIDQFIRDVN